MNLNYLCEDFRGRALSILNVVTFLNFEMLLSIRKWFAAFKKHNKSLKVKENVEFWRLEVT